MKLILIRRTETNKGAGLSGEPDAPSPVGHQQIGKLVAQYRNENVEAVFHSAQPRAVFTAEALALALDVPSIEQPGLEERNFGDWNSREWPQIKQELDKLANEERYAFVPPHGESWQQMEQRLQNVLQTIGGQPYKTVAIVTHYGPIRALLPILKNEPKESTLGLVVEPGQSFVADYKGKAE